MHLLDDLSPQLMALFKEEALELLDQWEKACLGLLEERNRSDWDQLFAAIHSIKGSIQTIGLKSFSDYLEAIETFLSLEQPMGISAAQIHALLEAQGNGLAWIKSIESVDESVIAYELQVVQRALRSSPAESDPAESENQSDKRDTEDKLETKITTKKRPRDIDIPEIQLVEDVKVSGKLVDKIVDQLNEIKTHHEILESHFSSGNVSEKLAIQSLAITQTRVRDLRRIVADIRSINAELIFQRLKRAVAEANVVLDKNVHIDFEGQLTKLDKSIADQIVSPLIHLVRNSVDHGIEPKDERIQKNKDPNGHIRISVKRHIKHIEFTIHDDGGGIDTRRLFDKALANNAIKSIPLEFDSDYVLQLLCTAGFSTSDSVNEVSGRGVGMNAVLEKITSLGGTLSLEYQADIGTTFRLKVPNSFSSIKAIVVEVCDHKLAIPMSEISEVFRFPATKLESGIGAHKLEYNGDIIDYVSLVDVLTDGNTSTQIQNEITSLIDNKMKQPCAFGVDRIIGQQEVVIRPLQETITRLPGCQGAAYFTDGSPGLVLSLRRIKQDHVEEEFS